MSLDERPEVRRQTVVEGQRRGHEVVGTGDRQQPALPQVDLAFVAVGVDLARVAPGVELGGDRPVESLAAPVEPDFGDAVGVDGDEVVDEVERDGLDQLINAAVLD